MCGCGDSATQLHSSSTLVMAMRRMLLLHERLMVSEWQPPGPGGASCDSGKNSSPWHLTVCLHCGCIVAGCGAPCHQGCAACFFSLNAGNGWHPTQSRQPKLASGCAFCWHFVHPVSTNCHMANAPGCLFLQAVASAWHSVSIWLRGRH